MQVGVLRIRHICDLVRDSAVKSVYHVLKAKG
jgi:hypothetical protein